MLRGRFGTDAWRCGHAPRSGLTRRVAVWTCSALGSEATRGSVDMLRARFGGAVLRGSGDVRGVRAPGACRVRASAHRLCAAAPLSGLDLPCSLQTLAHGIASGLETARAHRRSGAYGLRARVGPTPSCTSPDRGAEMIAGGRRRGRDKPPARVPHVHPPMPRSTAPPNRARACLHSPASGQTRTRSMSTPPASLPNRPQPVSEPVRERPRGDEREARSRAHLPRHEPARGQRRRGGPRVAEIDLRRHGHAAEAHA